MKIIFSSHFPHQEIKKRLVMLLSARVVQRAQSGKKKAAPLFFFLFFRNPRVYWFGIKSSSEMVNGC